MIGKRGGLLVFLYMIFLVVLFLMCSTDLIIREPKKKVYQISVIVEDDRDDNYSNFKKGMEQAAVELHADVRFITLYERLDTGQQMELLNREEQDGADILIVAPVSGERVADALSDRRVSVPVVLLGTKVREEKAAGMVTVDEWKMGEQLAGQMLQKMPPDCPVLVLAESDGPGAENGDFLKGAMGVLRNGGHRCRTAVPDKESGCAALLEEYSGEHVFALAGSADILTQAAEALSDDSSLEVHAGGLYGRGSTLPILNALDQGWITGICVADEFSRGYFSVQRAVQFLEGDDGGPVVLDSYYIEKEDLRKPEYEKILCPIE